MTDTEQLPTLHPPRSEGASEEPHNAQEPKPRGELRVFLGAAPGVGKSYAMLTTGHRLRDEGHDVVVGFVEPHGRPETEALIGDLEVIPRQQITYRGIAAEEMDTDAILRRNPEFVLIDELAHTNVPGSLREKRYQDVGVLLGAGINVLTTLNIQHLESLQEIIYSITGIRVRETIPDRILDEADEVHLIDLPTEDLLERLAQGKVYPPAQAEQAMRRFFRPGNLIALRQLALRRTAEEVDEVLEAYMRQQAIDAVWPAAQRVVVAFDDSMASSAAIRHAWRLASALHGELLAVTIVPADGRANLRLDARTGLTRNARLAEDLGATVRRLSLESDDAVSAKTLAQMIGQVCRDENATIAVLTYEPPVWYRRLLSPSVIDLLMEEAPGTGIYLVDARAEH